LAQEVEAAVAAVDELAAAAVVAADDLVVAAAPVEAAGSSGVARYPNSCPKRSMR